MQGNVVRLLDLDLGCERGWTKVCKFGLALICSISFSLIELCMLLYSLKHSGMCVGTWSASPLLVLIKVHFLPVKINQLD